MVGDGERYHRAAGLSPGVGDDGAIGVEGTRAVSRGEAPELPVEEEIAPDRRKVGIRQAIGQPIEAGGVEDHFTGAVLSEDPGDPVPAA